MAGSADMGTIFASLSMDLKGLFVGKERAIREIDSMSLTIKRITDKNNEQMRSAMSQTGMVLSGIGATAGLALGIVTREGAGFEKQMRNVNSISKLSEEALQGVSEDVKQIAMDVGKFPNDLASGLYDIASSGFQGAEGVNVLNASAVAAKAGLAETAESAKGLVAVLNAYGYGADRATYVSDVLFKTVDRGVITFPELSQEIGSVVAAASSANVPLEQIGAAIATMTKAGINAAETTTSLTRIIIAFLNPTKELEKAIHAAGYASGEAILQERGLAGAVEFLQRVTGGSATALAELGMDARALRAAMSLSRQEGRAFAEDLAAMENAAGSTAKAFEEQSKALTSQWEKSVAAGKVAAINFAQGMLPILKSMTEGVTALAKGFADLPPAIQTMIAGGTALVAILGILGGGALLLGSQIAGLVASLSVLGVGLGSIAAAAGPIGLAIAGIAALALAVVGGVAAYKAFHKSQVEATRAAADAAEKQATEAGRVKTLVSEYEVLRAKKERTREEDTRMHTILQQIADLNPALVAGFDNQGRAVGLVTEAVRKANREWEIYRTRALNAALAAERALNTTLQGKRSQLSTEQTSLSQGLQHWTTEIEYSPSGTPMEVPKDGMTDAEKRQVQSYRQGLKRNVAEQESINKEIAESNKRLANLKKGVLPGEVKPAPLAPIRDTAGGGPAKAAAKADADLLGAAIEARVETLRTDLGSLRSVFEYTLGQGLFNTAAEALRQIDEKSETLIQKVQLQGLHEAKLAKTQAERVQAQNKVRTEMLQIQEQQDADHKRFEEEKQRRADQTARFDAEHGKTTTLDYLRGLQERMAGEQQFSDKWLALHSEIEGRASSLAESLARSISDGMAGNKAEGVVMLEGLIPTFQAFGTAGVQAIDRVNSAREGLLTGIKADAESAVKADLERLEFERSHNRISTEQYIKALEVRRDANKQYSDDWLAMQAKIEQAHADEADVIISAVDEIKEKHREDALAILTYWINVFEAMGDAGLAAKSKLDVAFSEISAGTKAESFDWGESFEDMLSSIRQQTTDIFVGLIEGTTTFKDALADIGHQILRYLVNGLIQSAIEGKNAFSGLSQGIGNLFQTITGNISMNLLQIGAQAMGVMAIFGGNSKKRSRGLLGGLLTGIIGATTGLFPATIGNMLTGAGIFAGFDDPHNDATAVKWGGDFGKLFAMGANAALAVTMQRPRPVSRGDGGRAPVVTVTTNIDKVQGIEDVERIAEATAWIVQKNLQMA